MQYLIDTNILIYFVNRLIPPDELNQVKEIIKTSFNISIMTRIELLGWNKLEKSNIDSLKKLLSKSTVIKLTNEIEEKTILLKQQYKLKTPDAIIAATALTNNLTLLTRNVKDYCKIDGLILYNPFENVESK
jgi:toxin FitB